MELISRSYWVLSGLVSGEYLLCRLFTKPQDDEGLETVQMLGISAKSDCPGRGCLKDETLIKDVSFYVDRAQHIYINSGLSTGVSIAGLDCLC